MLCGVGMFLDYGFLFVSYRMMFLQNSCLAQLEFFNDFPPIVGMTMRAPSWFFWFRFGEVWGVIIPTPQFWTHGLNPEGFHWKFIGNMNKCGQFSRIGFCSKFECIFFFREAMFIIFTELAFSPTQADPTWQRSWSAKMQIGRTVGQFDFGSKSCDWKWPLRKHSETYESRSRHHDVWIPKIFSRRQQGYLYWF